MKKLIAILMTIAIVGIFAAGCNKDASTDTSTDTSTTDTGTSTST
ncbi:MAG TPA: hypothetical protein VFG65_03505 [Fimbriimonadales bacterium]|jgi:hypothetical protein|nr:hypothetical protein [Fimbriimonadales bacterium]